MRARRAGLAPFLVGRRRSLARRLRSGRAEVHGRPTSPARAFGRDFALTDHTGKPRTLADFRGKVVVLFFGYTQCPDVCPTTLATLAEVMQRLGPDAASVQVLFVTIDPERDTAELLSQYVPAFNPSFVGLSGDAEATARTAKEFKILYQKQPGRTPGSYTMDHSAGTFVFDPQGRLRLYVGYGQGADVFVHDIRELLRTTEAIAGVVRRTLARAPTSRRPPLSALDQLDLVAVGVLHERDDRRAALDRARLARHRAADFGAAARTAAHAAAASSTSIAT